MARVLILEARFYDHIADMLLAGAAEVFGAAGVYFDKITVPGIFELPSALNFVLAAEQKGTLQNHYDGYVTLGCAIRGESDHYEHICTECMRGLNELALARHIPLGNGVLTVHNEAQALVRSDPHAKNIGGMAARACLRMMDLKRQLKL